MPELLLAIEKDVHELSGRVAKTLALLAASGTLPGPALYQRVMRDISELRRMWEDHRAMLSRILPLVLQYDAHPAASLARIDQNATAIGNQLEALNSAAWPRNPEIGVRSIRVRGKMVLTAMLLELETERVSLVPLMRRWTSSKAKTSITGQLASA